MSHAINQRKGACYALHNTTVQSAKRGTAFGNTLQARKLVENAAKPFQPVCLVYPKITLKSHVSSVSRILLLILMQRPV